VKWTISQEVIDYSVNNRVSTVTTVVIEADSADVVNGVLVFFKKVLDPDDYQGDILVYSTQQWDSVKLVTEE